MAHPRPAAPPSALADRAVAVYGRAGRFDYPAPAARTIFAESLLQLIEAIDGEVRPLVLIEGDRLTEGDLELAGRLQDLSCRPLLAVLAVDNAFETAVIAARRLGLGRVLPGDCLLRPAELKRWIGWFEAGGPEPGLAAHLEAGSAIERRAVAAPSDKQSGADDALAFVQTLRDDPSFLFDFRLILEEAMNNCILHAFGDDAVATSLAESPSRRFAPDDGIWIQWGADERTIAVAVSDNRGALTRDRILSKIERQVTIKGVLDESGRGIYLIHALAARAIFNLRPGRLTETVALFPRKADGWGDLGSPRPILIFDGS
jgi:hypothetical protein